MIGLVVLDGCRTIRLTQGKNALIDEADYELVGHLKWQAYISHLTWYAKRGLTLCSREESRRTGKMRRTCIQLHCAILCPPRGSQVDHKNGDGLDNRRDNLRIVSQEQNQRNRRRSSGASRFKGVHRAGKTWRACIYINGKLTHLGCFSTQEQAARAYDDAAREHFGEFAATNAELFGVI